MIETSRNVVALAAVLLTLAAPLDRAGAQERYPSKPIRIVIGSTPGATPDILARMIGTKLGERWGQSVVIENRVPAVNGYALVAKSTPAGYALLLVSPAMAIRAVTPKPIRDPLSKEIAHILSLPDIRERLTAVAFHITPTTPEEHDRKLRDDIAAFAAIVKEIGLRLN